MYSDKEIIDIINKFNVKLDNYSFKDIKTGLNIELEHGLTNKFTNITNNDLEKTMKIVLAHLNEFNNYYNENYGLPYFENELKKK